MSVVNLEKLFNPDSVAVIGASHKKGKVGHDVLVNLIRYGYKGKIYAINPKPEKIMGLKPYPKVTDVKGKIDLAVFAIPAPLVPNSLFECGKAGIPAAIIISAGFKECGPEGAKLEREVAEIAKVFNIRVLGPNCLGLINTASSLNASFAAEMPSKGDIAFFSQSGALCTAILDWAVKEKIGFSKFVSLGNKVDISEATFLESLGDDPDTKVILGYIEDVKDGREFMRVARKVTAKKPVIICKAGGTQAGARAASSHTGSLAGSEAAFNAAFVQTGIVRAHSVEDLFNYAVAFSYQKLPKGERLAIITNAGGPGIIAVDAVERSQNAKVASFDKGTIDYLRKSLPVGAAIYNPVDVIGDADEERYRKALEAVLKDPNVDGALVILTPQTMSKIKETAACVADLRNEKPLLASFMGGVLIEKGLKVLHKNRIPNYPFPERAVAAFDAMVKYGKFRKIPKEKTKTLSVNKDKVKKIIDEAIRSGQKDIPEYMAQEIIESYGFALPKSVLAKTASEACFAANKIGCPVVMKIASPTILHKSDIGGVKIGLVNTKQVEEAFYEMTQRAKRVMPDAVIMGVLVQEMVTGGKEVILGMSKDSQFGPLLMFGLGGIYVEVLKDVSFRIAPITSKEAKAMIDEIRANALLRGARGEKPTDIESIKDGLLRLSKLVTDFPIICELDINPLMVFPVDKGGSVALDVRINIGGQLQ
ncbi:MAG: acetate--CoA ligase alpha subunit [Candidatus Omnitrophota bacterium]